ncbi:MAG: hypothetical protein AAF827_15435 [Cyanobacteria bacterium P01_D01_bin.6]
MKTHLLRRRSPTLSLLLVRVGLTTCLWANWVNVAYGQEADTLDTLDALDDSLSSNSLVDGGGGLGDILGNGDVLNGDLGDILGGSDLGDILGGGGLEDILGSGGLEDILGGGGLEDILGGGGLGDVLGGGGLGDILGGSDLGDILGGGGLEDILGGGGLEDILGGGGLEDILGGGGLGDVLGGGGLEDILGGGGLGDVLGDDGGIGGIGGDLGDLIGGGDLGGLLGGGSDDGGIGGIGGDLGDLIGGGDLGGLLGGDGGGVEIDLAMPSLGETFGSWQSLATTAADSVINNVIGPFQSSPSMVVGALGVPDVLASQAALQQAVLSGSAGGAPVSAQGADRFNVNPHALGDTLSKELTRAASTGFSHTLLSEEGQQAIEAEVQAADETLVGIADTATSAQELDVTQDVMKSMVAMEAQLASIGVAEYGQTIQLRQQIAADALVQTEAAEELAALNRRENSAEMGAAAEVIKSSATLLLFEE